MSGILSSSLWRANGSELTYAGSVSAQGRITQDKNGVHKEIEPGVVSSAPPLASAQRFSIAQLRAPSANKLALPEGAQVSWRSRLTSPRVNLTTKDGKRVSLQHVADPRGGGRPPIATMLYDGDRPVSLIEGLYQKDGARWKPTRARITIFGKDGRPSVVTENDFTALQTASVAMSGTAAVLADGFRRVGGSLSKLIQPDALYAASTMGDDDEGCWKERLAVAAAAAAQVAADVSLGIATAACAASGGILCPTVLVATLGVAATAVNYLIKVAEYDDCMSRSQPIISSRWGGSGGGGGGGTDDGGQCHSVIWEISYDGGASWQYYDTQTIC